MNLKVLFQIQEQSLMLTISYKLFHDQFIYLSNLSNIFVNYFIKTNMQPYIEQHAKTIESRTNFVKSLNVKLKQGKQTINKDQIIIIETYSTLKQIGIEVVVRKVSQLDYLEHHLYDNYGGHIIPFIHSDLYFQQDSQPQQLVQLIQEYLNDLCNDYYCAGDEKFFNFLLNQEVFSPQQQTYDKVLSRAAIYSRRYLNSIFARKQINQISNPMAGQFVQIYKSFCVFSNNFKQFRTIVLNYDEQQQLTEDIFSLVSELSGQLSVATIPVEYLNTKTKNKINRIHKMVLQGVEAFKRWEMLNQTVRQIQGNVRKGLHEQHKALHNKQKQLQKWTKSLSYQYKQIIQSAEKVIQKVADEFLRKRKEQFQSLCQVLKHRIYTYSQIPKKQQKQLSSQNYIQQKQQGHKEKKQSYYIGEQTHQDVVQVNLKAEKEEENTFQTSEVQKYEDERDQKQIQVSQNNIQEILIKTEITQKNQEILNVQINQQKKQLKEETIDQRQHIAIDQYQEKQVIQEEEQIEKNEHDIKTQLKGNSQSQIQNAENKQVLTQ